MLSLPATVQAIQGDLGSLRSGMTTLRMAGNLTTKRFNNLREDLRELEAEILSLNETLREQQVRVRAGPESAGLRAGRRGVASCC